MDADNVTIEKCDGLKKWTYIFPYQIFNWLCYSTEYIARTEPITVKKLFSMGADEGTRTPSISKSG